MRPCVGITSGIGSADNRCGINSDYVTAIERAGGLPVIIPPYPTPEAYLDQVLSMVDCLLFTGGGDVSPGAYGDESIYSTIRWVSRERDTWEIALIREAYERRIPTLGVCRGFQIANVAFGGTMFQDVSMTPGADAGIQRRHLQEPPFDHPNHVVEFTPDSRMFSLIKSETRRVCEGAPPLLLVNSMHHQAIKDIAEPFKAVAWCGNVVEAIEAADDGRFFMGVQWHPEFFKDRPQPLFEALVSAGKARMHD